MPDAYVPITVTVERTYLVPIDTRDVLGKRTLINGWSIEEVAKRWFDDHPLDSHHATRDSYRAGETMKRYTIGEITVAEARDGEA